MCRLYIVEFNHNPRPDPRLWGNGDKIMHMIISNGQNYHAALLRMYFVTAEITSGWSEYYIDFIPHCHGRKPIMAPLVNLLTPKIKDVLLSL